MNEYRITRAAMRDVPAIAALFTECFRESVLHHCGKLPKPQAMQDVFALVYEAEPAAALLAVSGEGEAIGYCLAPTRLTELWVRAITGGHVFRWAWRWLSGRYGFGLHPVRVIFLNKLAFLRSAATPTQAAQARILSVAVTDAWRGRGVASALMGEAMTYFLKCGVPRVRLEVRPDNVPAIRVYEKWGFTAAGYTYDSQGPWLIMLKEMEQNLT